MIRLLGKIPNVFFIAVSGGIDSMVALDFLLNGRHRPQAALYFNHGTQHGTEASLFLKQRCEHLGVKLIEGAICKDKTTSESQEEYWRNERYRFFSNYSSVITAHHLNDVMEWWVFSSLHGNPRLIPHKRDNIIRPFLKVPKNKIKAWALQHNVFFIDDPSNKNTKYMRNHIRHNIIKQALVVNPGLGNMLSKKIERDYINNNANV